MVLFGQSEESKYIKRINEQLADIHRYTSKVDDNTLVTPWSKAVRSSGLEFTKTPEGRYKIANTKANQSKVADLQRAIDKYKPQTVGEYKKTVKEELKRESAKIAERKGLKGKHRTKYIRQATTRPKIEERARAKLYSAKLQSMLDYMYITSPDIGHNLGQFLSSLTKGKKRAEIDTEIFNAVTGVITDEYKRLLSGALTEEEEYAAQAKAEMTKDYAFGGDTIATMDGDTATDDILSNRKNRAR